MRTTMHDDQHPGDRGQATVLVAVAVAFTAVVALGLTRVGLATLDRAGAQAAADASALAGAAEGRGAAEEVAAANHGRLATFQVVGSDVVVTVRVGDEQATARARAERGGRRRG